jgi:hypothetical protein
MNTVDGGRCIDRRKPISFKFNSEIIWFIDMGPTNPAPTNPAKIIGFLNREFFSSWISASGKPLTII